MVIVKKRHKRILKIRFMQLPILKIPYGKKQLIWIDSATIYSALQLFIHMIQIFSSTLAQKCLGTIILLEHFIP